MEKIHWLISSIRGIYFWMQEFQGKETTVNMKNATEKRKHDRGQGTEMNTCLGYTESQRNQAGTHTGLWYGDMAQCCAHTVDRTGCSGDRRTLGNRLQCGQGGEESGWQGEIEELYRMRVIKEFWTTWDQTNRSQKYRGEGRRRSGRLRLYCNPPLI